MSELDDQSFENIKDPNDKFAPSTSSRKTRPHQDNGSINTDDLLQSDTNHSHNSLLEDSEEEDEFVKKYGEVNFQYIDKPADSFWWVKPHALNYFKDGVLYRTKGERTSGKIELFLDLLYVGIVSNLASSATEEASAGSFLKYILLFIPTWTVWSDVKDFVNYYYSEDLAQKLYILWIMALLILYDNNCDHVLEGTKEAAFTVVPYILCRTSLAISLWVYSMWVQEHRLQMRVYGLLLFLTSSLWIIVIFVDTRAKIGVTIALLFIENFSFSFCYHPWVKKNIMKLTCSTALNIEHEVERFGAFYVIAIGEFLYKTVAGNPIRQGFNSHLSRGVCCLIISYVFLWLYFNSGTSSRATHALRRSGYSAIVWIYSHIPLIAGLILAADSAGDWIELDTQLTKKHPEQLLSLNERSSTLSSTEEAVDAPSMYALSFFFTGGICVSLWALGTIAFAEKSRDSKNMHIVTKFWRVFPRFPAGVIILCMSFAEMRTTELMGLTTMICALLFIWESITITPRSSLPKIFGGCSNIVLSEQVERF